MSFCSCVFQSFSIAITSLGEERANLSAFRTFVRFVLVWICRFPLPLGVWEGLRFVIVALPGLFSYLFFFFTLHQCTEINRFVCKRPAFRTQNDRSFSVSSTSADFEATSKVVSLVNMESSGGYAVLQNFMSLRVEQHFSIFNQLPGYFVFCQK